jgi:glyoxylase-like metal-dependent hydrolase (beta-lactamase superfamily II)
MRVSALHLTDVTPSPDLPWARPTFPVFAFLVEHRDGPVLIDTGVGLGHVVIDELYSPVHHDLDEVLAAQGVKVADIATVITSHLHFDHCGQNNRFPHARVLVQRAEVEAAREPLYTVPEWAFPNGVELTEIDGDHHVAPGIEIIATPGHTVGHQSVLIDDGNGQRTIACCQGSWGAESFRAAEPGDDGWNRAVGAESIRRLRSLDPTAVLFSHDSRVWIPATSTAITRGYG